MFGIRGHWEALQEMNSTTERRRKKALLIVNPCAGKNRTRANLSEIVDAFPDGVFDFTIKYTTCQGDAINIARDFAREHDLVICCGGDGTLNETVNGIMRLPREKRPPLSYLPGGSTNDFAQRGRRAYRLGTHKRLRRRRLQRTSVLICSLLRPRHKDILQHPAEDEKSSRVQCIYDKR